MGLGRKYEIVIQEDEGLREFIGSLPYILMELGVKMTAKHQEDCIVFEFGPAENLKEKS